MIRVHKDKKHENTYYMHIFTRWRCGKNRFSNFSKSARNGYDRSIYQKANSIALPGSFD